MALPAQDNFNRANENPLGNGTWATQIGMQPFAVVSNQAVPTSGGNNNASYWTADAFNNDQYAQVKVTTIKDGGPTVRASSSAGTFYLFSVKGGGAIASIQKAVNGSFSYIGSTWNPGVVVGDILRLEISGTTLQAYVNGVASGPPKTDSAIASGAGGIYNWEVGGAYDDWEAGNLGGGGSALLKIYNEAVNSTSGNPRLMAMNRPVAETQSLTEGTLRRRGLLRALGESISLASAALRRSALVRLANSALDISESTLKSISALLVRVVTGTVQAAEGEARRLFLSRHAGEELAVTEGVARRGFLRRVLNGSMAITEGALRGIAFVRAIGETVSLAGAAIRRSSLVRLAVDAMQLAEGIAPVRGFIRVISSSVSVIEGVAKGMVGALGTLSDNLSVVFVTIRRGILSRSRKRGVKS